MVCHEEFRVCPLEKENKGVRGSGWRRCHSSPPQNKISVISGTSLSTIGAPPIQGLLIGCTDFLALPRSPCPFGHTVAVPPDFECAPSCGRHCLAFAEYLGPESTFVVFVTQCTAVVNLVPNLVKSKNSSRCHGGSHT